MLQSNQRLQRGEVNHAGCDENPRERINHVAGRWCPAMAMLEGR